MQSTAQPARDKESGMEWEEGEPSKDGTAEGQSVSVSHTKGCNATAVNPKTASVCWPQKGS